ncbi:MAG: glycosyltransferase family 4 protein [Planctomycetota bacterium]
MSRNDMKVQKILFVAPEMRARGTNEYIVHLAKELRRRGVDVTVFCGPGPMLKVLGENDIPLHTFDRLGEQRLSGKERERFKMALEEFEPQLIHAQTAKVARMVISVTEDVPVPLLLTLHAVPSKARILRSIVRSTAGIVATSQYLREELVNECGVEKSSIHVIPNGIDMDGLAHEEVRPIFQNGIPVIGCVGPVEKARGYELFVKAAAKIVRDGQNWQFVVGGEGEELPRLRKMSTELGLDDSLTFVGNFSSYAEILDALDIVVQSAQVQVSGFSILDAMGRGRPVVAFNTGTACELIDSGSTGVIVPMDDINRLSEAIVNLAGNPDEARRMGEAARREVAETFNIRKVTSDMLALYSELIPGK